MKVSHRRLMLRFCCSCLRHPPPAAASVTVPDNSTSLAGVAAATTALLLDAGVEAAECRRRGVRAGREEFPLRSAFERGAGRIERARRAADAQMPDQLPEQARHDRRSAVRRGPRHDRAVAEGAGLESARRRPSAIAAWAIAASSRSPSSAPSIPRSAISATAAGGAAFSPTGSDDRAAKPDPAAVSRSRAPPLILCQPTPVTTDTDSVDRQRPPCPRKAGRWAA